MVNTDDSMALRDVAIALDRTQSQLRWYIRRGDLVCVQKGSTGQPCLVTRESVSRLAHEFATRTSGRPRHATPSYAAQAQRMSRQRKAAALHPRCTTAPAIGVRIWFIVVRAGQRMIQPANVCAHVDADTVQLHLIKPGPQTMTAPHLWVVPWTALFLVRPDTVMAATAPGIEPPTA